MPEKLTHAATVVDGNVAWFAGGYVGNHPGPATRHVWKYDLVNEAWSAGPDLPAERGAGGVALLGRRLHFFGGMDKTRTVDKGEHWSLDLATPGATWVARPALPNPRNHLGASVANGKLYAVGGQTGQEDRAVNQPYLHAFDPATNAWTRMADLPLPRSHFNASTFVRDGRITVVGGEIDHNVAADNVWSYEPLANRWLIHTALPSPRRATTAVLINNLIYVTGGYEAGSMRTTTWVGA
jgi:N-acetylneuraminic acid mutarotase